MRENSDSKVTSGKGTGTREADKALPPCHPVTLSPCHPVTDGLAVKALLTLLILAAYLSARGMTVDWLNDHW